MTLAFSDDPPTRWMFPEPSRYLRHFQTFMRLYAGAGFDSRADDLVSTSRTALVSAADWR